MDKINEMKLLGALNSINVSDLSREEWIEIGMALKHEGLPASVWDEWSQHDSRYKRGECGRLWNGFRGSSKPVTGATVFQMAKERGWSFYEDLNQPLAWDDEIEYDGKPENPWNGSTIKEESPGDELKLYLKTLFKNDEYVGFVTDDVWQNEDGKFLPGKGVYRYTAGHLIELIDKYNGDIHKVVGDWKEEAGAWIRFNPLDGNGVKNENVTAYRYTLVESDSMPIDEQYEVYKKHELPIAALVYSGGKSLHAIVHIDAKNADEYSKRVSQLYDYLKDKGISIDRQNKNPSRLSRMPGVTRNGKRQYLAATNIGRASWAEWLDFVEDEAINLPPIETLDMFVDNPPALPEEMIEGVLRRGHKMLISGPSKAGKSFLLMELCIAFAEGGRWLGFKCKQSRVLYVNLEIDRASAINRFLNIYKTLKLPEKNADNISVWNLRGRALTLDKLTPKIIRMVNESEGYDVIVIDPIYKIITGDENNASEMGAFCNWFDKICTETGCSTIYCHHHSKGAQGQKKAMDRASGSGVFARDPDAQLDLIELELPDDVREMLCDNGETAWRLEATLREFKNPKPVNLWFDYPIHRIDESGELAKRYAPGDSRNNLNKSGKRTSEDDMIDQILTAYDAVNVDENEPVTLNDLVAFTGFARNTVKKYVELAETLWLKNGVVGKITE